MAIDPQRADQERLQKTFHRVDTLYDTSHVLRELASLLRTSAQDLIEECRNTRIAAPEKIHRRSLFEIPIPFETLNEGSVEANINEYPVDSRSRRQLKDPMTRFLEDQGRKPLLAQGASIDDKMKLPVTHLLPQAKQ